MRLGWSKYCNLGCINEARWWRCRGSERDSENGVTIEACKACKACADKYKLSPTLKELGVEVKYMTEITAYIKGDDKLISI